MNSSLDPLQILSDTNTYPFIPQTLIQYAQNCFIEDVKNRFSNALSTKPVVTVKALNNMFKRASNVTGLTPDNLLNATGFHPKDLNPQRIDSAFAEIRAISFLANEGFQDIQPLYGRNHKEADFVARHGAYLFAIEVADSVFDATKRVTPDDLVNWAIGRAQNDKKLQQIERTKKSYKCNKGVFLFAVDTESPTIWLTRPDFLEVVKRVWRELGSGCDLHIGCFTGRVTLGNIPDDVMFPEAGEQLLSCIWKKLRVFFGLDI